MKYKQIRMGLPMIRFPARGDKPESNDLIWGQFWDFSNLGLTEIPHEIVHYFQNQPMDEFVDALDFSHNYISNVPKELDCLYINHLDLSYNNMNELPNDMNFRDLETLDLSYNKFSHFPTDAISNAHNLIDLNMDHNQISKIPFRDMHILSNIALITLNDNPIEYEYYQKEQASMRIGVIDYKKMARSRFKFRISNYSDLDLYRMGLDKMEIIHRRFANLSWYRFMYYEQQKSYLKYNKQDKQLLEHEIFWERFNEMVEQFKDLSVKDEGDYIDVVLNDITREKEFDEWVLELFDGCLVE